ncbi:hypothetical protein [Dyella ginsengisoli]|uniref:hypothetical protein n=1 Tax=Dyella ginsengisoli TaxID=363848 RepID=UPI000361C30F|nr:hypothetical protein [Dyella ginsengisoli]
MEQVKEKTEVKHDPALTKDTWWHSFNAERVDADYTATSDLEELPSEVQVALGLFVCDFKGLGEEDVNWNVTRISKDGRTRLNGPKLLNGGQRSGKKGCGEDALWAVPKDPKNKKNIVVAKGSAEFCYLEIIYLIDAGLCPCRRCCKSFIALAERTRSIIVVRPMVDYELISKNRTELARDQTFLLLFRPGVNTFLVCHTAANEAPASPLPRDLTVHPTKAWCTCTSATCGLAFTARFSHENVKALRVKKSKHGGLVVEATCPHCHMTGEMTVVAQGIGAFPPSTVDIYH